MPLKTPRAKESAIVTIDNTTCKLCGLCAKACKSFALQFKDGKLDFDKERGFSCFACGHCAMICPSGSITVEGRELHPEDIIELPSAEKRTDYESLFNLLLARRSMREFQNKPVERELIDKIIQAAETAPMGLPPSDVRLTVFDTKEKLNGFVGDYIEFLRKSKGGFKAILPLFRLMMSADEYDLMKTFALPLFDAFLENWDKGVNLVTYDAPVGIYFSAPTAVDPADPYIAATYAMLAGEALGLGTIMIGSVGPMLKHGGKELKNKYGLLQKHIGGLMVLFGYPAIKYHKAVKRTFGKVDFI